MNLRLLYMICAVFCVKLSSQSKAGVKVSLQLVSFKNPSNKDLNGKCCELICYDRCDYFFKLCLKYGANNKCVLNIQTKQWDNTNDIVFNKGAGQLGNSNNNPLVKELPSWKGRLKVSIDVLDYDSFTSSDLVDKYVIDRRVTPTAGILQQTWTTISLKGIPSSMNIKYSIQCNRDYYGPSCTKYCKSRDDSTGHYTCDLITGQKVCRNGWHGNDCLTFCLPQDDDINGHYSCEKNTGKKICHNGWYGNSCTTFCMARNDSQGGYSCDSNGRRICLASWFPSNQCDVFCDPRNDSTAGYMCNLTTGQKICLPVWTGPECDCKPRNDSTAGYSCNKASGERICHEGWYGSHCNVFCIPRNDSRGHYNCNHANGAKKCLTNWFGNDCNIYCPPTNETVGQQTKCSVNNTIICARNWYTVNCSVHCEPRDDVEGHYKCDQETGQKICLPNWHGTNCTVQCIPRDNDWFGHFDCDENGQKRCHESWYGHYCKLYCKPQNSSSLGYFRCRYDGARLCLEHWYGTKCLKYCKGRNDDLGHYTCSNEGNRVCLESWYGQNCSIQCLPRDDAQGHFTCDRITGQEVCLEGWTGQNCTEEVPTEIIPTTSQQPPKNRESKQGRSEQTLSELSLALILGGFLFLICIIVGVVIIICSRRQIKRPATPFPYLRYKNTSAQGSLERKTEESADPKEPDVQTNQQSGIPNVLSEYDDNACLQKDVVINLQEISWNPDGSRQVDEKLVMYNNPLFVEGDNATTNSSPAVDPRVDPSTGLRDNSDWVAIFESYCLE